MISRKYILHSLLHALAVLAYVAIVAFVMQSTNDHFGNANDIIAIISVLMLFTVSAAITGSIVFGKPVYLFLNGEKKSAVEFLILTIGWLFVVTILIFAVTSLAIT